MKDQAAIKKLQLLKTMQPSKKTLKRIKEGVYYQAPPGEKAKTYLRIQGRFNPVTSLMKSYGVAFYTSVGVFLLVIFLSVSFLILPNQTHNVLLYEKLTLAPNQYEKARIALEDTKSRFADNKTAEANTNELAYSLTVTNSQLNALKLKGENGKYTAQQCHQIYQEYLLYLERTKKSISPNNSTLKSQINSYEEQAERKLHMYKSL